MEQQGRRQIAWWLLAGVVMIYFQVVIGGITRLTGSGLSITKWEIVTGAIPPLDAERWNIEFDHYKATPQYHKLNQGMTLSEFKFIYFWEYFHRLWARLMGFVFAIPFVIFLYQKKFPAGFVQKLLLLILLVAITASMGWIMVMSGLESRPWVDAYKLTLHLTPALISYSYLLWLFFSMRFEEKDFSYHVGLRKFSTVLLVVLSLQLVLGGLMSGMRAGFLYPTFPDMHGAFIPDVLLTASNWSPDAFTHYDTNPFAPTLVQFLHRMTAYLLVLLVVVFYFRARKVQLSKLLEFGVISLIVLVLAQALLGIFTVLNFAGGVPVTLGVLHQAVAILLLTAMLLVVYLLRKQPK